MGTASIELLFLFLLIFINGILAMAEIAVVSARKTRLQQQAEAGVSGAQAALDLANEPSQLLSTVQIGITLIGILAGAFGGATLAEELQARFAQVPFLAAYAPSLAVAVVVLFTTYVSLVVGELAPKQIGLAHAERIAAAMARPMRTLAHLAAPVVAFLGFSTTTLLRLVGFRPSNEPELTEEEIKIVIEQGAEIGVIEPIEGEIVDQVFRLSDLSIGALMTPRTEVTWIDLEDPIDITQAAISNGAYSQYPVALGSLDNLTGIVKAKDLLKQYLAGQAIDIQSVQLPAIFLPEGLPVYTALERFRQQQVQMAMVIDEYGGVQGLVTITDIVEAIVGQFPEPGAAEDPDIVQREDGSYLLDGMILIDRFKDLFDLYELPGEVENLYQTLGGFVMHYLGRIPKTGDEFTWNGVCFEVVDMDGHRVDKILASLTRE
jgi:putative hemolysin